MTVFDQKRNTEFSRPEEIRRVQEDLLGRHLRYCASNSPYYRRLFHEQGLDAAGITLDMLHRVPFTDKTALSEHNDDFLAVPMLEIVDIVLSSGTTGRPTTMMYNE